MKIELVTEDGPTVPCDTCRKLTTCIDTQQCHSCRKFEQRLEEYLRIPKGRKHVQNALDAIGYFCKTCGTTDPLNVSYKDTYPFCPVCKTT